MMKSYRNVAVALLVAASGCMQDAYEDEIVDGENVSDVESALGSGTPVGGGGVVELEVQDLAKCTGFLLNPYMIMTAAHCVYSGQREGTKQIKVRKTNNGTTWSCISGSSSGQACSGWAEVSYAAWQTNSPDFPDPTSDYAIIYRQTPFNDSGWVGIAPNKLVGVALDYQVWGRGTTGQMRYDESYVEEIRFRIFMDPHEPSLAITCEGDSGAPAFPYHYGVQSFVKYAASMAVQINPAEGEGRAGACAAAGETMIYHQLSSYTLEAINWVATDRLGLNVCPYCTCRDVESTYPGSGFAGYYVCNAF
jgi:V8-like Glu-specific endopeptidase